MRARLLLIRRALQKAPGERTDDDIDVISEFVKETESFCVLTPNQQRAICQLMTWEECAPKTFIFNYGDAGDKYYVILSGMVTVLKPQDGALCPHDLHMPDQCTCPDRPFRSQGVLEAGMGFGEIALTEHKPRAASIQAVDTTELLVLKRADYEKHAIAMHRQHLDDRLQFLMHCTRIQEAVEEGLISKSDVSAVANMLTERSLYGNEVVCSQGSILDELIIVRSGSLLILRAMQCRDLSGRVPSTPRSWSSNNRSHFSRPGTAPGGPGSTANSSLMSSDIQRMNSRRSAMAASAAARPPTAQGTSNDTAQPAQQEEEEDEAVKNNERELQWRAFCLKVLAAAGSEGDSDMENSSSSSGLGSFISRSSSTSSWGSLMAAALADLEPLPEEDPEEQAPEPIQPTSARSTKSRRHHHHQQQQQHHDQRYYQQRYSRHQHYQRRRSAAEGAMSRTASQRSAKSAKGSVRGSACSSRQSNHTMEDVARLNSRQLSPTVPSRQVSLTYPPPHSRQVSVAVTESSHQLSPPVPSSSRQVSSTLTENSRQLSPPVPPLSRQASPAAPSTSRRDSSGVIETGRQASVTISEGGRQASKASTNNGPRASAVPSPTEVSRQPTATEPEPQTSRQTSAALTQNGRQASAALSSRQTSAALTQNGRQASAALTVDTGRQASSALSQGSRQVSQTVPASSRQVSAAVTEPQPPKKAKAAKGPVRMNFWSALSGPGQLLSLTAADLKKISQETASNSSDEQPNAATAHSGAVAAGSPRQAASALRSPSLRTASRMTAFSRKSQATQQHLIQVGTLGPFQQFGEAQIADNEVCPVSLVSDTVAEIYVLSRRELQRRLPQRLVGVLLARDKQCVPSDAQILEMLAHGQRWESFCRSEYARILSAKQVRSYGLARTLRTSSIGKGTVDARANLNFLAVEPSSFLGRHRSTAPQVKPITLTPNEQELFGQSSAGFARKVMELKADPGLRMQLQKDGLVHHLCDGMCEQSPFEVGAVSFAFKQHWQKIKRDPISIDLDDVTAAAVDRVFGACAEGSSDPSRPVGKRA